jgi:EKC/KEOPS complex subunit PCC1/LAGE3
LYDRSINVPFEDERQAEVAYKSLNPDPELRPDQLARDLNRNGNMLEVKFKAVSDRTLRVGVNSFMDNLNVVVECLDELDVLNKA